MKIIKKILHGWYIYLIACIASTAVVLMATNSVNEPVNEEIISLFVASCSSNSTTLKTVLRENRPDYVRRVSVTSVSYSVTNYDYMYTSFGKTESDLIILPESKIYDSAVTYYYTQLDESYMNEALGDVTYYTPEDKDVPYGVLVRSAGDTENGIISFSDEEHDENYYAFLYKKSVHAGKNNGTDYDTSVKFIDIIRNYK